MNDVIDLNIEPRKKSSNKRSANTNEDSSAPKKTNIGAGSGIHGSASPLTYTTFQVNSESQKML